MQSRKSPLHERLTLLGACRGVVRGAFFRVLEKTLHTDDARQMAADAFRGLSSWESKIAGANLENTISPYPELGRATLNNRCAAESNVIIISARFRSGSTLLWNLFRNIPDVTAYYEPFNERRWFDPESRGDRLDATHRGVSDYWREYDSLGELARLYREEWTHRHLFMDRNFWNPQMKRYIEVLIEKAAGRPVLQFNRVDFRLPWIKHNFPCAKIIHLYRNPRDQWCSSLMDLNCVSRDAKMDEFRAHDKFYLMNWATDLKYHFPFLDEKTIAHPYQLYYYIWKLSYLFGVRYAHHSLSYEDLILKQETTLGDLLQALGLSDVDVPKLKSLIEDPGAVGKWTQYADDRWFKQHETACETVLSEFLRPSFNKANCRRS